jgi:oligopeptide transport system substrate-binding protein
MIRIIVAALLLAIAATGCGRDDRFAGMTVYRHSEDGVPTSLDPLRASTVYANLMLATVYDTLYRYKYLARPYELVPNLATDMPTVSDDGLTYTIRLKQGVQFIDDPAFPGGVGREVVAEDFVYSMKRHFHPDNISQGAWVWEGRIAGMDEWVAAGGDYDAPVAGLRALDDYTLEIRLTEPFPQFDHTLAMGFASVLPREAVEHHGEEIGRRPVGSGPYRMVEFRTSRAVLERNGKFREEPLDLAFEGYDAASQGHLGLERLAGRVPPFVDRLEVDFIEEPSSRWASFISGREIRYTTVPVEQVSSVLASTDPITLRPQFDERYHMHTGPESGLVFSMFNMQDPEIGFNPDPERNRMNHELRCAIRDAFSWEERNDRFYAGLAVIFPGLIPPTLPEFDPELSRESVTQNVERARQRLADAGWTAENLPQLEYAMVSSSLSREMYEQFRGYLTRIGYPANRISTRTFANFGDYSRAMSNRELMILSHGWSLAYPDVSYIFQVLYGPNESPGANSANYRNDEYDALFERAGVMQPGPERTELYRQMNQIVIDDCVGLMGAARQRIHLWHRDVIGLPDREVLGGYWLRFVDVATPDANGRQ